MKFDTDQIFHGSYPPEAAKWCNENDAHIKIIGDHIYQICANKEPTIEEKQLAYAYELFDNAREAVILECSWRVERANEQIKLGITPVDDLMTLLTYRQYLRDYPESSETWYENEPLDLETWMKNKKETN